ncbi:MAG: hypothetical protein H6622_13525 [Halobacteriovoraceae bacterium]|nr:hypothetical protein [Halobacteriovoraceae bacterium]
MSVGKIIYVGNDQAYWSNLQQRFKKYYPKENFEFKNIWSEHEQDITNFFIQIRQIQDILVLYLDFSRHTSAMIGLAKYLRSSTPLDFIPTIGLMDYLIEPFTLKRIMSTGILINHIKSDEISNVIFHGLYLTGKPFSAPVQLASGKLDREASAEFTVRFGNMSVEGIHAEFDYPFEEGKTYEFSSNIDPKISAKYFKLVTWDTKNLYYSHARAGDFETVYKLRPNSTTKEMDKLVGERDHLVNYLSGLDRTKHKEEYNNKSERVVVLENKMKKLSSTMERESKDDIIDQKNYITKWIESSIDTSFVKRTRVLAISPTLHFLNHTRKRPGLYFFSIRFHAELDPNRNYIEETFPHIIALEFTDKKDKVETEKKEENKEEDTKIKTYVNEAALNILIKQISQVQDYKPIIVVYQTNLSSTNLKEAYSYDKIMSTTDGISLDHQIHKFAKMFEAKHVQEDKLKKNKMYYFSKMDESSFAVYKNKIQMLEISESEVVLKSEVPLPIGTVLQLTEPINVHLTIVPDHQNKLQSSNKENIYLSFIHGMGEIEIKELRHFINSVFFEELEAKKKSEKEEFKKLNEKVQHEKTSSSKKDNSEEEE